MFLFLTNMYTKSNKSAGKTILRGDEIIIKVTFFHYFNSLKCCIFRLLAFCITSILHYLHFPLFNETYVADRKQVSHEFFDGFQLVKHYFCCIKLPFSKVIPSLPPSLPPSLNYTTNYVIYFLKNEIALAIPRHLGSLGT
jgi:hypothetical protein